MNRLARTAPDSAELAALNGDFERGREQWARAFESYRRALATGLRSGELHTAIAAVYEQTGGALRLGRIERAREPAAPTNCAAPSLECDFAKGQLRQVAAGAGETPDALYWRVRASRELARRAVEKLGQLPPSPERFQAAALASERAGQYREAAAAWKEALQLAPGNAAFERQLALALCHSNDCGSALSLVKNLLDREPANAQLNYLYGAALNSTQSAAQALPFLEAAVKLDGSLLDARAALGQAYLETGNPERAIPELEAAVAQDPEGTRRYQLARAYQAAGKQERPRPRCARTASSWRSEKPGSRPNRESLRRKGRYSDGSRTSSTRLVRTFRSTCFVPMGQTISTSTSVALPVPKCTGEWLDEA